MKVDHRSRNTNYIVITYKSKVKQIREIITLKISNKLIISPRD